MKNYNVNKMLMSVRGAEAFMRDYKKFSKMSYSKMEKYLSEGEYELKGSLPMGVYKLLSLAGVDVSWMEEEEVSYNQVVCLSDTFCDRFAARVIKGSSGEKTALDLGLNTLKLYRALTDSQVERINSNVNLARGFYNSLLQTILFLNTKSRAALIKFCKMSINNAGDNAMLERMENLYALLLVCGLQYYIREQELSVEGVIR